MEKAWVSISLPSPFPPPLSGCGSKWMQGTLYINECSKRPRGFMGFRAECIKYVLPRAPFGSVGLKKF